MPAREVLLFRPALERNADVFPEMRKRLFFPPFLPRMDDRTPFLFVWSFGGGDYGPSLKYNRQRLPLLSECERGLFRN